MNMALKMAGFRVYISLNEVEIKSLVLIYLPPDEHGDVVVFIVTSRTIHSQH
jgi:hypothetical protein